MHNLTNEYFQNEFETSSNEYTSELSPEFEFSNEYAGESAYELSPEYEFGNQEMEMNEAELTQELMEINSEAEFGAWLKKLGKKVAGVSSSFLNSPIGQQATAALGDIASKTLPGMASKIGGWAGGKIGGLVGKAGYGRQLGQQYGAQAGQAAASRYPDFVKFSTDAISKMSQEFESGAAPAVKPAIVRAAKKHYPFILKVRGTLYARPGSRNANQEFENYEYSGETYGETGYEMEGEITSNEGTFNEVTEMELASELLSLQSEAELDRFLGKLFKKAVGAVKGFANSGPGKALGGMLKGIAKKALPVLGGALGSAIPIPGVGTAIGSALGTAASNLFELELEGLSPEDREFESARAFVRFAGNSARRASGMGNQHPQHAARKSITQSAKRYAPGLLVRDHRRYGNNDDEQTGTWYRDGNRIIIENI